MFSPITAIQAILPVYILIIGGAIMRKTGLLKPEHDSGIMHVIFSVMLPCFILDRTLGAEVLRNFQVLATGAGLGFSLIIIGIGLGFIAGKMIGLTQGTGIRTFSLAAGCQNFGFTAVPVVEILWGSSAVALLFVHNLGVEVAVWSVGVMLMSGERGIPWRRMVNGPIISVGIGLTLVGLGWDDKVTGPLRTAMSMLGAGCFPLAILITGASIMDLVGTEKPSWKIVTTACVVRLFLAPATIILCAKWIPMTVELKQIFVVQAAMPAAMTPILLAKLYGGRPAVAVQIMVATTVVSIFTLPYIISYGVKFLELTPITP